MNIQYFSLTDYTELGQIHSVPIKIDIRELNFNILMLLHKFDVTFNEYDSHKLYWDGII